MTILSTSALRKFFTKGTDYASFSNKSMTLFEEGRLLLFSTHVFKKIFLSDSKTSIEESRTHRCLFFSHA